MSLKKLLNRMFLAANDHNLANILSLASVTTAKDFLDLGCDDGVWTMKVASGAGAQNVFGVELNPKAAAIAQEKGIEVSICDLKDPLPFAGDRFDLIHTNQVIEHVPDIDRFASEAFRVLRKGGRMVLSTENGSSWHNIFAAAMGWQTFSLTNLSSLQSGVGNPLALHRGSKDFSSTWTHKVIFNYRGLIEFLELHGFRNIVVKGAGYYPLPTAFAKLDPRHAHFITLSAQKPST